MTALSEESTRRVVSTPSGDILYHEAGSGSPLLLVHGSAPGTTGWATFRHNIGPLAEHHRVLAIDMPGWGGSYPTPYDPRHQVDALVAFMDAVGLDRAAIIGSSLGGVTGLQLVTDRPDRVTHLVTIGAAAPGVDLFASKGPSPAGAAFLDAFLNPSAETIRRFSEVMVFDPTLVTEALVSERLERIAAARESLGSFLGGMDRTSKSPPAFPNVIQDLQRSSVPVLAIHGRDDGLVGYESALRIVAMVSDARLVLLGRCGHWAQFEKADDVNKAVLNFVEAP